MAIGVPAGIVPVGGVVAFLKSFTNCPTLPAEYVECNGQTLSDAQSVFNGQTIPNLNASNFLMGSSSSGGTSSCCCHYHCGCGSYSTYGICCGSGGTCYVVTCVIFCCTTCTCHLPPYYSVVWVMRVK